MTFGLSKNAYDKLKQLFSNWKEIDEVVIYGSRAMGNFHEGSDIDLTIKGSLTFSDGIKLMGKIDELDLPYLVDLNIYNTLDNKDLIEHIDRNGKQLYP